MYEPAAAVTDWILCLLNASFALAAQLQRKTHWAGAFLALAAAAAAGAVYHAELRPTEHGEDAWALVSALVAASMLSLYLASVVELVPPPASRRWLLLGLLSASLLAGALALGAGDLPSLVGSQALALGGIVLLWVRAWRRREPHAGTFVAAMVLSGVAATLMAIPVRFELGWTWDSAALYHLAQIPGLLVLFHGVRRRPAHRSPTAAGQEVD